MNYIPIPFCQIQKHPKLKICISQKCRTPDPFICQICQGNQKTHFHGGKHKYIRWSVFQKIVNDYYESLEKVVNENLRKLLDELKALDPKIQQNRSKYVLQIKQQMRQQFQLGLVSLLIYKAYDNITGNIVNQFYQKYREFQLKQFQSLIIPKFIISSQVLLDNQDSEDDQQDQTTFQLISYYNTLVRLYPTYSQSYYLRANTLLDLQNYTESLTDFNKALQINPQNAKILYNRAILYEEINQIQLAKQDYQRAKIIDPTDSTIFNNLGILYQNIKNKEKALQNYNEAIKLQPNQAQYFLNRCLLYKSINKYQNALQDCNSAIQIDPKFQGHNLYLEKVHILKHMNELDKAIQEIQALIEMDLQSSTLYIERGQIKLAQKKFKSAFNDFRFAHQLNPFQVKSYIYKGVYLQNKGLIEQANIQYMQAMAINPSQSVEILKLIYKYEFMLKGDGIDNDVIQI